MFLASETSSHASLLLKPGRWTVGSAATCSFRVAASGVQSRHALIVCGPKSAVLKAWDARTWSNGQPVSGEVVLNSGDRIQLGSATFSVQTAPFDHTLELVPESAAAQNNHSLSSPPLDQTAGVSAVEQGLLSEINSLQGQIESLRDDVPQHIEPPVADNSKSQNAFPWQAEHTVWLHEREQLLSEQAELRAIQFALRDELLKLQTQHQIEIEQLQSEVAQLQQDANSQQATWAAEHTDMLEETLRIEDQLAEALVELESLKHASQLQNSSLEPERLRLDQLASELHTRQQQVEESESQLKAAQAALTRDQQVFEHSWNWVQNERKQLTHDKELALATHRHAMETFEKEKADWEESRRQTEADLSAVADQLEATRAILDARFLNLQDSTNCQSDRDSWPIESTESPETHAVSGLHAESSTTGHLSEAHSNSDWTPTATPTLNSTPVDLPLSIDQRLAATASSDTFEDAWSIGVDLTDSLRNYDPVLPLASVRNGRTEDWDTRPEQSDEATTEPAAITTTSGIRSLERTDSLTLSEVTSLAHLVAVGRTALTNNVAQPTQATWLSTFVDCHLDTGEPITGDEQPVTTGQASDDDESDPAAKLRAELAAMFNLPELNQSPSYSMLDQVESKTPPQTNEEVLPSPLLEQTAVSEAVPIEAVPPLAAATQTTNSPLNFTEDENIDDSVSRYMQHLLARSRTQSDLIADEPAKRQTAEILPTAFQPQLATPTPEHSDALESNFEKTVAASQTTPRTPVHVQDKAALRAATESMRYVANLQTRKNVETSNWRQIKSSIKAKSSLAAFAFVLSIGLIYLGTQYKPEFLMLGVCSVCIGVLTWIDLFIAIRTTRAKSAQLAAVNSRPEQNNSPAS